MSEHQKHREKPRLSAAKMGEYIEAAPRRRERILEGAKFPSTFITGTYKEASAAIRRALVAGGNVRDSLHAEARRIALLPGTTRTQMTAHASSARAVRAFAQRVPELPLDGVAALHLGAREVALTIEGVAISVFPQVLLERRKRDGTTRYGALLVVMRREESLGERSGKAVAEMVRRAVVALGIGEPGAIDAKLCLVVDVFHPGVYQAATRGGKRITDDLESACREITIRWPGIRAAGTA